MILRSRNRVSLTLSFMMSTPYRDWIAPVGSWCSDNFLSKIQTRNWPFPTAGSQNVLFSSHIALGSLESISQTNLSGVNTSAVAFALLALTRSEEHTSELQSLRH